MTFEQLKDNMKRINGDSKLEMINVSNDERFPIYYIKVSVRGMGVLGQVRVGRFEQFLSPKERDQVRVDKNAGAVKLIINKIT
jgi:hypothetical protein